MPTSSRSFLRAAALVALGRVGGSVQLELQAREHIDIGTRCLTVRYKHTNSRDVEQCRASVDSPCVTSNL